MKKYILPIVLTLGLATAVISSAQFMPPTLTPSCNPSAPGCGVPPPVNVGPQTQTKKGGLIIDPTGTTTSLAQGNLLEVKGGNISLSNARIVNDSNSPISNPAWIPNSSLSSFFAFDTDGIVSSYALLTTAAVSAGTDLLSQNLKIPTTAPNYADIPTKLPLCSEKTTGKIIACGDTTTPPATSPDTITISVKNMTINGQPQSVSGTNPTINISSPDSKVIFDWEVTPNDYTNVICWNSGTIVPPIVFGSPSFLKGKINTTISETRTWALACRNKTTSQVSHMQIFFTYSASGTPANNSNSTDKLPSDVIISTPTVGLRWRENTLPIPIKLIIKSNGSTSRCKKTARLYSSTYGQGPTTTNPWTNSTNQVDYFCPQGTPLGQCPGDSTSISTTSWTQTQDTSDSGITLNYKCTDFFNACAHETEGARVAELSIECYNGNNGQTINSPIRSSVRLEWLNPK